jgi:hypothetical protein
MEISMPRSLLTAFVLAAAVSTAAGAQAATVYTAALAGPPVTASPGTGFATATLLDPHTLRLEVSFSGLLAGSTVAHIHAPTDLPGIGNAGVATQVPTFIGFPTGVTAGAYDHTFDLSDAATWNPAFITANGGTTEGARSAFLSAMDGGKAYLNIHTSQFPAGEIRGFFSAVPEPQTWALMIAGFGLTGLALRRRRLVLVRST